MTPDAIAKAVLIPALQYGALGVLAILGVGALLVMRGLLETLKAQSSGFVRAVEALEKRVGAVAEESAADARETREAIAASERRVTEAVQSAITAAVASARQLH